MEVLTGDARNKLLHDPFIARLAAGVLLLNLFIASLVWLSLRQNWHDHEQQASLATQNLSLVLKQELVGDLSQIDLALFAVSEEIARQNAGGAIDRKKLNLSMARIFARLPYLEVLRMANDQGEILCGADTGARAAAPSKYVADRDYFIRLRSDPGSGLVITKPVIGRISGKLVVVFARRLNKPDGSFAGAVWAAITVEHFTKLFSQIDVGKHGIISMFDSERSIIARYPEPLGSGVVVGKKYSSPELRQHLQEGRTTATFSAHSTLDGIERMFSYQKISSHPIYVIVGLAKSDYMAEWRSEAAQSLALAALFIVVVLFLSWMLYCYVLKRRQAEEEKEKLINELRSALENVKQLSGLLPMCAACKKIRNDKGYWEQIEFYIREHSEAQFTHGICPECIKTLYPDYCDDLSGEEEKDK
ncbi:MAG: hypothetical protein HQL08_05680 [Nitrospirae bacterium]|nr:hypothetical protein [Nitrospirota bacterium]